MTLVSYGIIKRRCAHHAGAEQASFASLRRPGFGARHGFGGHRAANPLSALRSQATHIVVAEVTEQGQPRDAV
jgi:hypothetical protein